MTPRRPPASIVRVFRGRPSKGGTFEGTAFFIESSRALTARHVLKDNTALLYLQVGWSGVSEIAVQSCILHPGKADVALLIIDPQSGAPLDELIRLADVEPAVSRQSLILLGFADQQSGIEERRAAVTNIEGVATALITDPWPTPGMSGGPAISEDHVLHGINSSRDQEKARGYVVPFTAFRRFLLDNGVDLSKPACPYPGLASFGIEDAGRFFGRDEAIERVTTATKNRTFTALVGASGTGKSSLLLAGVLPKMKEKFVFGRCRLGEVISYDPFQTICSALAPLITRTENETEVMQNAQDLTLALKSGRLELISVLGEIYTRHKMPVRIVIDQFEEIFTLADPALIEQFFKMLFDALAARQKKMPLIGLIITMRADFYGEALRYRELADLLQDNVVNIGPMNRDELKQAITRPAEDAGVILQKGLDGRLINDVDDRPGNLPLLQFALRELWEKMQAKTLDLTSYEAMGGLATALAQKAEEVFAQLITSGEASEDVFRQLFTRIALIVKGGEAVRRVARAVDLGSAAWRLAQRLAEQDNRLVVVTGDKREGTETAEIVHEALVRSWPRLARWIQDDESFQQWLQKIDALLNAWQSRPDDKGLLLRGGMLTEGKKWLAERGNDLNCAEHRFIEESRRVTDEETLRDRQRTEALDRAESLRLSIEADRLGEAEPETALRLAWEALLWNRNELTVRVFREAVGRIPATTLELLPRSKGYEALDFGWGEDGEAWAVYRAGTGRIWKGGITAAAEIACPASQEHVSASVPDGIVVGFDGRLELFDWTGTKLDSLRVAGLTIKDEHRSRRNHVITTRGDGAGIICSRNDAWSFRASGRRLVLRANVLVAEAETAAQRSDFGYSTVASVIDRFADRFLLLGSDEIVRCFDLDGNSLGKLEPLDHGRFHSLNFLGDGTIAAGGLGGRGDLWRADGTGISSYCHTDDGPDLLVRAVDRTGAHFATIRNRKGGPLTVRDASGRALAELSCGEVSIGCAAFSADGRFVAAGSDDGSVRVWDWRTRALPFTLAGHVGAVRHVLFHSADSNRLLTCDHENSLRHWSLAESVLPVLRAHSNPIKSIGHAGNHIVTTAQSIPEIVLWEEESARHVLKEALAAMPRDSLLVTRNGSGFILRDPSHLTRPHRKIVPFGFPDHAEILVTASDDNSRILLAPRSGTPLTAILYSSGGEEIAQLAGPNLGRSEASPRTLAGCGFAPDGARLAIGCRAGMIWTWTGDGQLAKTWLAEEFGGSSDALLTFQLDPLGAFLISGTRNALTFFDWNGQRLRTLNLQGYKPQKVAVSPDGALLVTITDNAGDGPVTFAELWARDGTRLALLDAPHTGYYPAIHFDPQRRYFFLQGDDDLRICDCQGNLLSTIMPDRNRQIVGSAIAPSGECLAVIFDDGAIRFWTERDRRWTTPIRTKASGPVVFTQNGQRLLAAHRSGLIEQFPVSIDGLFDGARARLTRGIDSTEALRFAIRLPAKLFLDPESSRP